VLAVEQRAFGVCSADQIGGFVIVVDEKVNNRRLRTAEPIRFPQAAVVLPLPSIAGVDSDLLVFSTLMERGVGFNRCCSRNRVGVVAVGEKFENALG
jgi:hypothetical protein